MDRDVQLDQVQRLRTKAEELRIVAEQITNPITRESCLNTAGAYDRLAQDLEMRLAAVRKEIPEAHNSD